MGKKKGPVLTNEEKDYVRKNHKTLSVPQMREEMKRSTLIIRKFMASESLQPFQRKNRLPEKHPWRSMNSRLDDFRIDKKNTNQLAL